MNEEETNNSKAKKTWKKLPLKVKLTIIGICIGFFFIVIFIVVMIAPLMSIGVIDIGLGGPTGDFYLNYSDINSSNTYWWPIGSSETESIDGITLAAGDPIPTTITSEFGTRKDPLTGELSSHTGTDIAANDGSLGTINIIAAKGGTVIYPSESDNINCSSSGNNKSCGGGYGNYVMIEHNDGTITLYGHLYENSITVRAGDLVMQGQVIGKMGSSGRSTGSHLHFEVRVNGDPVNGLNYVSQENPRPISIEENVVEGNSNKQTVCLTLSNSNYSQNGVIALMTNINAESSFNPNSNGDYDNGVATSYGLCQWHNERWDNLKNTYPGTYNTIGGQLSFLTYELKNGYSSLYNDLISGSLSAEELTYNFCKDFEKPDKTEITCQDRKNSTSNFSNYVKNECN